MPTSDDTAPSSGRGCATFLGLLASVATIVSLFRGDHGPTPTPVPQTVRIEIVPPAASGPGSGEWTARKIPPEPPPVAPPSRPAAPPARPRAALAGPLEGLDSIAPAVRLEAVRRVRDAGLTPRSGLRALLPLTADPDPEVAAAACDAVSAYDRAAGEFLAHIAAGLVSASPDRRSACVRLLDAVNPVPPAAAATLRGLLEHDSPDGRASALRACGRIAPRDFPPGMLSTLLAGERAGRLPGGGVADVLTRLAPLRPEHAEVLASHSGADGSPLAGVVARLLEDAPLPPAGAANFWAGRLTDPDPSVVVGALNRLDALPGDSAGLSNRLPALCEHRDGAVRAAAVRLYFARLPALAALRLEAVLADPDPRVREAARVATAPLPGDRPDAEVVAGKLARSADPVQTRRAAEHLRDADVNPVLARPIVERLLRSRDPETVAAAIDAVPRLGPVGTPLRPAVTDLVTRPVMLEARFGRRRPPDVVLRAAVRLFEQAGDDGVDPLALLLRQAIDDDARAIIVEAIGAIGPPADRLTPELLDCCVEAAQGFRMTHLHDAAIEAIGRMGPGAVRGVRDALSEDGEVRWFFALRAAGRLGRVAAPLREKVKGFLAYRKSRVIVAEAADALRRIGNGGR